MTYQDGIDDWRQFTPAAFMARLDEQQVALVYNYIDAYLRGITYCRYQRCGSYSPKPWNAFFSLFFLVDSFSFCGYFSFCCFLTLSHGYLEDACPYHGLGSLSLFSSPATVRD